MIVIALWVIVLARIVIGQETEEIKMIIVVTAEGISTPKNRNVVSPDRIKQGQEQWLSPGFEQLTNNGRRQMYLLGKSILEDYPMLLGKGIKEKEVVVYSYGHPTSSESAVSFLSAIVTKSDPLGLLNVTDNRLYPFTDSDETIQILANNTIFHEEALPPGVTPVAVSSPTFRDQLFSISDPHVCPYMSDLSNAKHIYSQAHKFVEALPDIEEKVVQLYKRLDLVGNSINHGVAQSGELFFYAYKAVEILECRHLAGNLTESFDQEDPLFKYFYTISDFSQFLFLGDSWAEILKIEASPLLEKIMKDLDNRISSTFKKMYLYSGSRQNLYGLQGALLGIDVDCMTRGAKEHRIIPGCREMPDFSSNFIIELVAKGGKHYVRTRYEGVYVSTCDEPIDDEYFSCELLKWKERVKSRIYMNWIEVCRIPVQKPYKNPLLEVSIVMGCSFVLVVSCALTAVIMFFKTNKDSSDGVSSFGNISSNLLNFKPISRKTDFNMDQDIHSSVKVKRI